MPLLLYFFVKGPTKVFLVTIAIVIANILGNSFIWDIATINLGFKIFGSTMVSQQIS